MGLKLSNNAISTLASGITASATSIPLAPGTGLKFPTLTNGDYFPCTISKPDGTFEIVKVTTRSGDTLTVTRAQEGTTALAFGANSLIELRLTAATVDSVNTLALAALPKSGGTMTGNLEMGAGTKIVMEGATDDAAEVTLDPGNPTADRTLTMPDKSGTLATTADINAPQVTVYTSGSGTYTTPANAKAIRVQMVGGGGGGGATKTNNGSAGGSTTFGSSLLTASGGGGGSAAFYGPGGSGGPASIGSGATGIALAGARGGAGHFTTTNYANGGTGGISALGCAGGSGSANGDGGNASPNSGSGGGGAGSEYGSYSSQGGGAGGYIDAYIANPAASYSYAVGAGGSGGAAGVNPGGNGGSGVIIVTAFF